MPGDVPVFPIELSPLQLQWKRFTRHLDAARADYDQVSMVDLAISLRVLCEMKRDMDKFITASGQSQAIRFPTPPLIPARRLKLLRKGSYVDCALCEVELNTSRGASVAFGPSMVMFGETYPESVMKKLNDPNGGRTPFKIVPRKCTFTNWLGMEVVDSQFPNSKGRGPWCSICIDQ